ncbi:hypothetical protein AB1Y20_001468 [Prymnesium parvum]|uniref:NAD(+) diphosphatase n=1 Tax=Prymnesium parvum TaxID=97485 RepID=A0AB34KBH5_PRYPA
MLAAMAVSPLLPTSASAFVSPPSWPRLHGAVRLSRAGSIHSTVFFDPEGRLHRTRGPSAAQATVRFVPVYAGLLLMQPGEHGMLDPLFLSEAQAAPFLAAEGSINAWLGESDEGALADGSNGTVGYRLLELSHLPEQPSAASMGEESAQWVALRAPRGPASQSSALLGARVRLRHDDFAALLATARGLALWHRSVRFCASCGGRTRPFRDGANQKCEACGSRFRPRTDPSVIMLVTKGDKCLLGRQAAWPEGRYSTLAGFVEFGETLEECVVREVREESGVAVRRDSVRFVASQPWLFPRSLMVGFIAEAESEELDVDLHELDAAGWFHFEFMLEKIKQQGDLDVPPEEGAFHVPSRISLARTLIDAWLAEKAESGQVPNVLR